MNLEERTVCGVGDLDISPGGKSGGGGGEFVGGGINRFSRVGSRIGRSLAGRHNRRSQEARLTRISLSIICLYLTCHFWKLIPTFYEAVYSHEADWPKWLKVIQDLSHVLIVFNSAVNFMLYLIM